MRSNEFEARLSAMAVFATPSPHLRAQLRAHLARRIASTFAFCLIAGTQCLSAEREVPMPKPRPRSITQQPAIPPVAAVPAPSPDTKPPVADAPPEREQTKTEAFVPHDPYLRLNQLPRDQQRSILHSCAAEWDRRKHTGTIAGLIWRDFLEGCIPTR